MLGYVLSTSFVIVVGVIAWWYSAGQGEGPGEGKGESDIIEWKSQTFGYISAVLYRELPRILIYTPPC